ncbi:hypothetical protein GWK48_10930 [Metallosphaera tengchongensis]|uniref:Ribbon-helix-helix protein, CopG family n=1 Tax=Metallosphaera tengchongensis TaxID=1532350 RepID=A0A6N0NZP1_9CREN|nr:DUF6364 family protein [Metallosphaera tengchongensis]QKR00828.1 hypothetical protein GWK48_10930 [Metallosphaera tengchongensis]
MKVKVTLSIDSEILKRAKEIAVERNTTLSDMFEQAISELDALSAINSLMKGLGLTPRLISFEEISKNKLDLKANSLVREMRDERLSGH